MNKNSGSHLAAAVRAKLPGLFASLELELRLESKPQVLEGAAGPDLRGQITIDGVQTPIELYIKNRITDDVIEQLIAAKERAAATIVVFPHLRAAAQDRLRTRGLNFADLTGTLSFRSVGVRIEVQGQQPPPSLPHSKTKQEINPFSKKASILVRTLCESYGDALTTSEIAERTSLSRGWISGVLNELKLRDYAAIDVNGAMLSNPAKMLRDWFAEYKWTRNESHQFVVPFSQDELLKEVRVTFKKHHIQWALTLLAGAKLRLNQSPYHNNFHVYVLADSEHVVADAMAKMHAEPVSEGGNLVLFDNPYYGKATLIGLHESTTGNVVSDVQLLLDLVHFPVRGAELAETLVQSRIAKQFKLTKAETHKLIEAFA